MMTELEIARRECLGAVLAGGQSRRMGAPKEGLPLGDGRPMIEHVLAALRAVCPRVVIVGESRGYGIPADIVHLTDLHPGSGPVAGLEALLKSGLGRGYLVAACDQPFLTPELLTRLLPEDPDEPCLFRSPDPSEFHPFPGYYPAGWAARAEEALRRGELSMRALIGPPHPEWPLLRQADRPCLRNLNRPADLAELRSDGDAHR